MKRILILMLVIVSTGAQAEQVFLSPSTRANLIELYTSEGCSSCPPADRWLSGLKRHPDLWTDLVPVAFHVDYWDHIGWKDRFSRPEFSERQRRYAREGGLRVVYTPGLLSNGREWRNLGWKTPDIGTGKNVGVLEATVSGPELAARFRPSKSLDEKKLVLSIALLGTGMSTDVRAGENAGRNLAHDFVVLRFEQVPMPRDSDSYQAVTLSPSSDVDAQRFALALWVSTPRSQSPIQATGGWLEQ